jgi:release factor glutamine methyltransferase
MKSVGKVIKTFKDELKDIYPSDEISKIIEIVFEHELNFTKIDLFLKSGHQLSDKQINSLLEKMHRLKNNEPVQYVLGETVFYDLKLKVAPGVLIPRQETEELVEWIINENKAINSLNILDIGTGSGCIAVTLAANLLHAKVKAYDVSYMALEIAKSNAENFNLKIEFQKKDILEVCDLNDDQEFDIIVSNPPYVLEKEKKVMDKNVLEYEPELALFVKDENPLQFYKAIINYSKLNLKKDGKLYFEINEAYGDEVKNLMVNEGFGEVDLRKDLNGKVRMIGGQLFIKS